jgi:hypothetical protein
MNKRELYHLLQYPDQINPQHVVPLETVTSKYPFFSIAQILLSKAYFNADSYNFTEQLKKASIYSGNRELLYDLIYYPTQQYYSELNKTELNNIPLAENETSSSGTFEQLIDDKKEVYNYDDEKSSIKEKEELLRLQELLLEIKEELKHIAEQPLKANPLQLTTPPTISDIIKEENNTKERINSDFNTISGKSKNVTNENDVISGKEELNEKNTDPLQFKPITLQNNPSNTLDNPAETIQEQNNLSANNLNTTNIEQPFLTEKLNTNNPSEIDYTTENIQIKKTISVEEPLTFEDWLKFIRAHGVPKGYEIKEQKIKKKEDSEETKEIKRSTPINETDTKQKKENQKNLIDKFIEEEPKIVPQKGVFFNPPQKAKESITENEDIYSETLAKIFEMQGNYKKAIKAYEILSLKFPEKSAYFATLIEKCNKLLKEK